MRKLTERDRKQVMDYVMREPEINLFLIGDIELLGFEDENIEAFANERDGGYDFLLLRYRDSYLLYSDHTDYDVTEAVRFLSERKFHLISGKEAVVSRLLPHFPGRRGESTFMARLNRVQPQPAPLGSPEIIRLTPEHVPEVISLYLQVEEFHSTYLGREESGAQDLIFNMETGGGRGYGAFLNGKLSAVAFTSAENSISAMVVGVATLPQARKTGLAGSLVERLCTDCLSDGKQFLCLFYDNPDAGRIYRRIGFSEIGHYMMLKKESEKRQ